MKHILLGDLGRSLDIVETSEQLDLQQKIQQNQSQQIRSKNQQIALLQAKTERLHLAITALTRFLVSRGIVAEEELAAFLEEIDATDGQPDGRLAFDDVTAKPRLRFPGPSDNAP